MSLATFAVLLACASSASALTGLTYEGKLMKPDGITPEEDLAVQFKVQIRTGDASDCLMLEETQTINMTGSGGNFALTVGAGSRTDSNGIAIEKILSNNGSLTFSTLVCTGGGETFTPGPTQSRKLVISFTDSTLSAVYQTFPPQVINFAPSAVYAQVASQVGDFTASSLLRATQADGLTPVAAPALLPAMLTELNALIGGTSAQYSKISATAPTAISSLSSAPGSPANGTLWYDSTGNSLKAQINGTTVTLNSGGAGTVTSVTAGTGLSGGTISTSGTISIAAGGVTSSLIDPAINLNTTGTLSAASINASGALNAASVTSSSSVQVAGGSAGSPGLKINGINSGLFSPAAGVIAVSSVGIEKLRIDTLGNVGIGTTAPATKLQVTGTVVLGDGGETCGATYAGGVRYNGGNIQFCNGTSWSTLGVAGAGITALTGDVTASGTGFVASTVALVGGVSAANVASGANLANAATNANTVSTIVKRDASGNFVAGQPSVGSVLYRDSGTNTVTLSAPATVTTPYSVKLPPAVASVTGQVLASDTAGNTSWFTLPTAFPPNGPAGGDLSGVYPNPTVVTVGGSTAATVNMATVAANGATASNTNSKIVLRDSTGNFAANVASVNGVALNNAGSILNITNPAGGAWNMVLPATAGSNGQVMQTNGSGVMSWINPGVNSLPLAGGTMTGNIVHATGSIMSPSMSFSGDTTTGIYQPGGGSIGFSTSGTEKMRIVSSGNVGIGTVTPIAPLDVAGHIANSGFAATVVSCGTGPLINGNDTRGLVTLGTGSPTSCTVTFNAAFVSNPHCVITPYGSFAGSSLQWFVTSSATNLIMTFSMAPTTSQKFEYMCMQ